MVTNVIPKEKQTAYQRWEMASFDPRPVVAPATPPLQINQAELDALREEARQAGYAQGFEQGFEQGHQEGMQAGAQQAAQEASSLQQIGQSFSTELAQANEVVAQSLLDLALDLSKAMLKTALDVRPELVLPIVAEAIRYLPTLQPPALLFLHPLDAQLVQNQMQGELDKAGWRVAVDPQLCRGGCRVETGSNQIDASVETRWQRIANALGKQTDWIVE